MSAITRSIQYVERDINFLDCCERIVGALRPELQGRREHQRRRLSALYEELQAERQWESAVMANFRREQARTCPEAPRSILVPMGMDQTIGTGRDAGFLTEDGTRTRRI